MFSPIKQPIAHAHCSLLSDSVHCAALLLWSASGQGIVVSAVVSEVKDCQEVSLYKDEAV